ncbi:MAG: hypothetical protein P1Q69_10315 [Candidatus Thorarchaeota archaeon]|nr:hypothetical protein [Candidatus Thorarchaeota archaeon]
MTFELETLDIPSYDGKKIWNSLLRQKKGPSPISIVFPGLHYNADMPLMYYSTGVLLEAGHSVLSVDTRYSHKENFMTISSEERTKWMFGDAQAVFDAVQQLEDHVLSVLIGKSLGALQIGYLVQKIEEIQKCKIVWLTPILKQDSLVDQMMAHQGKSLIVIGTDDPLYSDETLAKIIEVGRSTLYTVIRGNHSLDVPSGLIASMQQQIDVMKEMRSFVRS